MSADAIRDVVTQATVVAGAVGGAAAGAVMLLGYGTYALLVSTRCFSTCFSRCASKRTACCARQGVGSGTGTGTGAGAGAGALPIAAMRRGGGV